MQIEYKNKKIEKICTYTDEAEKRHGKEMAEKIELRVWQIASAETVEEMIEHHVGRCHQLKGKRQSQYAVDLVHPYRLVFEKKGEQIQIACIIEIVDYH